MVRTDDSESDMSFAMEEVEKEQVKTPPIIFNSYVIII